MKIYKILFYKYIFGKKAEKFLTLNYVKDFCYKNFGEPKNNSMISI